jgi:hypothetical protein
MPDHAATMSGSQPHGHLIHWTAFSRIAFRFVFCYLALFCLSVWDDLHVLYIYLAAKRMPERLPNIFLAPLWHNFVPWVGKHILHLATPITVFSNGSGDTTYDYVLVLCFIAVSVIADLVWSLLDSNRANYQTLHQWLRLAVAITLGAEMLSYGLDKAIPLQFGSLTFSRLSQPLGQMSPATLLWDFMAASKPYTVAVGTVEVLAGILLFTPRLTSLGALLSVLSMANVFALNMCYDIPVKLGSFHLLLMACFLLIPEVPRLLNVLVFNRPAAPVIHVPLSSRRWVPLSALILQVVVGVLLVSSLTVFSVRSYKQREAEQAVPVPLYGVWSVDEFTVDGNAPGSLFTPKLLQDLKIPAQKDRWERLIFQSPELALIQLSNGDLERVAPKVDLKNHFLSFTHSDDTAWQCIFSVVQEPDEQRLQLQGSINGLTVAAKFHREDQSRFILVARGFRWIQEYPYYR